MADNVSLIVNETIDNVVINPGITTQVIDVNVTGTDTYVDINVTPSVTIVNINEVTGGGGGGGSQNLQQVTDIGATTTNGINIIADLDIVGLGVSSSDEMSLAPLINSYTLYGTAIQGQAGDNGKGVKGTSDSGSGVYAYSPSGTAFVGSGDYAMYLTAQTKGIEVTAESDAVATLNQGSSATGLIINGGASSNGNFIELKKEGDDKLTVNQAGELTATKLIKSGGTSTQYLMADGSTTSGSIGGSLKNYIASGTDTYTVNILGTTAYVDGVAYLIRFTNGNTTTATLNINGLGARTLYKNNSGAIIGGDIQSGSEMLCVYNSTLSIFKCISTSTSVTATSPITSSGGITPVISTSMATNKLIGRSTAGTGVMEQITIGSGLTLSGGTLTNTATPTPTGYYGAFQDNTIQTAAAINTPYAMKFGINDLSNGITIASDGSNLTRITIANTGIYNIQFSAQFDRTNSGTDAVDIWLRKNGVDVPGSAGKIILTGGVAASAIIAAWNYVLDIVSGDYYQIMWSTPDTHIRILYEAAQTSPFAHPLIPSTILTVTQQSGIMAGTGITAINSLTGAAQTLTVGTTGTDFAIVDSGTDHKFNLPTASASNRGALSSTDWTTFNNKQDKSLSAYTIMANATASTADATAKVYKDVAEATDLASVSTITWSGTASPTTPLTLNYKWNQVGSLVTVRFNLNYTNAGTSNTQLSITLPTTMPTPAAVSGFNSTNDVIVYGTGQFGGGKTLAGAYSTGAVLRKTASSYEFVIARGAANASTAWLTIQYFA